MSRSSTAAGQDVDLVRPEARENEDVVRLAEYLRQPRSRRSAFLVSESGERVRIPPSIHEVLTTVVQQMAAGNAISIVPIHHELTTQEAADLLNVSRPHLVKLLSEGEIPFHLAGTHRRVRFDDLMDYRERRSARRSEILGELAREAAKLGL
jgi:excisionase family DNA binding protein